MSGNEKTEAAFLRLITADPTNAWHWAIYADWLEEQGDPRCVATREAAERVASLTDDTPVYRVTVDYDQYHPAHVVNDNPSEVYYGDQSRWHWTVAEADDVADLLSNSGYWGVTPPPGYTVETWRWDELDDDDQRELSLRLLAKKTLQ